MDMQTILDARAAAAYPQIDAPRAESKGDGCIRLHHDLLANTHFSITGIALAQDGSLDAHALGEYDEAIRDIVRRTRREAVFERVDQDMEWERPWESVGRPPSWATLTHPLFAYALRMSGSNDLGGDALAQGSSGATGVRLRSVQDLTIGRAMLDPSHPAAGKVECDTGGADLVLHADIPETTRHMLRGRALGALVQLRGCGDAHLDGIVASIPIKQVLPDDDGGHEIRVKFAPVPWVAPAEAPRGVDVTDLRRDVPCR